MTEAAPAPYSPSGALLVDKPEGLSSADVVHRIKVALRKGHGYTRSRDLPKLGHGGTLDPFATGLLVVAVGQGTKLARYFLGSDKEYECLIRFGEGNLAGDKTEPVTERSERVPLSIDEISSQARVMASAPYLQVPPMHSAKKQDGKRLYELARKGLEVERDPVEVKLHRFEIGTYDAPLARASVHCSSGTYIRTLAQDLARSLGSVALLQELRRTRSGSFRLEGAISMQSAVERIAGGERLEGLPGWLPIHELAAGMPRTEVSLDQATALVQGRQQALPLLARGARLEAPLALYCQKKLIAVAQHEPQAGWSLARVFPDHLPR